MQPFSEQVGQLLLIGFENQAGDPELASLLREVRPGGVIFFERNIVSPEEFQALVLEIRTLLGVPLFLAIDQEGGTVDRLRKAIAPLPPAQDVARAGMAREFGRISGRELGAFSLNVNFAPVLDLTSQESQPILGSRTAGPSPEDAIRFGREFLEGLAEHWIAGCGKHFPGLGAGQKDSHHALPCIEKHEPDLWREDLVPYRVLESRLPMVMVAHACYPELERALPHHRIHSADNLPASLSPKIIRGLLQERIGFQGLVLCDDLEMQGVLDGRSIEQAAVAAVRAGCHMLLVCRRAENVHKVFDALLREADGDPSFRRLVEHAAQKVFTAKRTILATHQNGQTRFCDWDALRLQIHEFSDAVVQRLGASSPRDG